MTDWNNPPGQPPPYGPPGYPGPQGYGSGYGQPYQRPVSPFGPESNEVFGITGAVLGILGGVALVVSFTAIDWFGAAIGTLSFSDVRHSLSASNSTGFATAYFGWLAWLFFIVAVVCAVLSSFPTPALRIFRMIGAAVGFAAAGLSFLALQLFPGTPYIDFLKDARLGFYLAVLGYLLAGIGAAIGPRKTR